MAMLVITRGQLPPVEFRKAGTMSPSPGVAGKEIAEFAVGGQRRVWLLQCVLPKRGVGCWVEPFLSTSEKQEIYWRQAPCCHDLREPLRRPHLQMANDGRSWHVFPVARKLYRAISTTNWISQQEETPSDYKPQKWPWHMQSVPAQSVAPFAWGSSSPSALAEFLGRQWREIPTWISAPTTEPPIELGLNCGDKDNWGSY
jgi:hypothetical protein